jgi:tRNA (cytidine/uridine-2'-O-)-methyltransferase
MFNIVLYTPQIPQNTGNIARSCALTGCVLHLIKPLGFSIDDKHLKRAGLDYWDKMSFFLYDSFEHFIESAKPQRLYLYTTKAQDYYTQANYRPDDYFMFGSETSGVTQDIHAYCAENRYTIPMRAGNQLRSLNLSNSVSIVLYEALRQNNFYGLK